MVEEDLRRSGDHGTCIGVMSIYPADRLCGVEHKLLEKLLAEMLDSS
jgi:hypothetical protein